jgi:serine/threonine-protein kinase
MGSVFSATDERDGTKVALKLLHPELAADPEIHRRFHREASILAALEHPAVVRVLDVGSDERDRPFTVMELLEGETLAARIERGPPMGLDEARSIVRDASDGLAAAHEHGVLHGDIKPANLFVLDASTGRARTKVVDFGLSKVHGLERLTRTGEVIGTPLYMAPELLTGEGEIDERIDTYAMGVVLHEMFAGRPPFGERNPGKLLFQIVSGQGDRLADRRPDLPEAVVEVVRRAMSAKRADRFASALELQRAFDGAAS